MRNCVWLLAYLLILILSCESPKEHYQDWEHYLGDPARTHYTTLDQISKDNLDELEVAWTYSSPDTGQMQMNPIIVNGIVYGVSAALSVFALDAESGEEIWTYGDSEKTWHSTSRGLAYWEKDDEKRVLYTVGKDLIALNAENGKLIESFGKNGKVDLHEGLPEVAKDKFIISNTPGAVYKDLIVMPVRLSEGADAAPGDIRAFNIQDGSLAWTFHVIPHPGEAAYDSWLNKEAYKNENGVGAANVWAGITVDEEEGVFYIPTGSLAPDFYGGHRPGTNLYANCLLAIKAETGELIWHQQLTHHDIWDRDLPAPPNLLSIKKEGRKFDVVAQVTKQGYVYVFDKRTGEPVYEIEEVEVPSSNIETAWPTQPIPVKPKPFSRRSDELTVNDFSPYAPNKEEIAAQLRNANRAFYNPPDTNPTLLLPGYDGGAEWGGAGVDPDLGIIYINANEMAWMLSIEEVEGQESSQLSAGGVLYLSNCSVCHGKDFEGNSASGYPSLLNIGERRSDSEILTIVTQGKGMMTSFSFLDEEERLAIVDFLLGRKEDKKEVSSSLEAKYNIPYKHAGYTKFLDDNGLPAISPPWGTLNAIDLNTGDYLWKIPFGQIDSLMELGYPRTGTESYGGPIVTENGLLIIAATKDERIRIFDKMSGDLLWEDRLPASSFATPSTYMVNGKQYIVLACGGEKLGTRPGNKIVAYALKKS